MSRFSQLSLAADGGGYGNGIDRHFSPILHYIDEFDRHFSHKHRFKSCFIPRFDLEEDAHNYYLYGDIPGANVNDITVDAHDNHSLVIYGKTERPDPERRNPETKTPGGEGSDPFVKLQVEDHEHAQEMLNPEHKGVIPILLAGDQAVSWPSFNNTATRSFSPPPTPTPTPAYPHHQRHQTCTAAPGSQHLQSDHRILLCERPIGDFHRTFAFPQPVVEEGVRASLENGVLSLVVPKREKGEEIKRGRRVPVVHGNWWKGQEQGSGFGFASGAV
jgi:HSP20 family protein